MSSDPRLIRINKPAKQKQESMIMNARLETFFSYGFRPFFLLGGFYAVIAAVPWVFVTRGSGASGIAGFDTRADGTGSSCLGAPGV